MKLDYAASLDRYQPPNNVCSVAQVATIKAQEREEETVVGVMKDLVADFKRMLAKKSPKKERQQEYSNEVRDIKKNFYSVAVY